MIVPCYRKKKPWFTARFGTLRSDAVFGAALVLNHQNAMLTSSQPGFPRLHPNVTYIFIHWMESRGKLLLVDEQLFAGR